MPCNCDHLEPTEHEEASKEMAQHLLYALACLGTEPPDWVTAAALDIYGDVERIDELAETLCQLCKRLSKEDSMIIYDGKNWQARNLANWWEAHQKADAAKMKAEMEWAKKHALRDKAKAKLTADELKALLS